MCALIIFAALGKAADRERPGGPATEPLAKGQIPWGTHCKIPCSKGE
jgi:hypothetical protein